MTVMRFAAWHAGGPKLFSMVQSFNTPGREPALLVSYLIAKKFLAHSDSLHFSDWMLDSGAFSAHTVGTEIDLEEYIDFSKDLLQRDPKLTEVAALDVIGDWKASLKNTERMWQRGVPATPCYHQGEPWDVLVGLARDYPRIAIGGMVGAPPIQKMNWVRECFSRIWPKRVHGFGIVNKDICLAVPFASVDATNWAFAPALAGGWRGLTPKGKVIRLKSRGVYDYTSEVRHYLRLESLLKHRWEKELAKLPPLSTIPRLLKEAS